MGREVLESQTRNGFRQEVVEDGVRERRCETVFRRLRVAGIARFLAVEEKSVRAVDRQNTANRGRFHGVSKSGFDSGFHGTSSSDLHSAIVAHPPGPTQAPRVTPQDYPELQWNFTAPSGDAKADRDTIA